MSTEFVIGQSEPNFKTLVEGVTDVIWSAEIDGTIRYLSPQYKSLFGFEPQDWVGRSPFEQIHPEDLKVVEDSLCLLYTSPSPRDGLLSRMPSSA